MFLYIHIRRNMAILPEQSRRVTSMEPLRDSICGGAKKWLLITRCRHHQSWNQRDKFKL